jgi:hypothetical protein
MHKSVAVLAVVGQGFPRDRPLFRIDCALNESSAVVDPLSSDGCEKASFFSRLVNVHEGLDAAGVSGGSVSLVSGQYEYYHYTQVRTCFLVMQIVRITTMLWCYVWVG